MATAEREMVPAMDGTIVGKVAYGALLRLIQTGEVRGQRVGKKWFVDLEDLNRWREDQASGDKPA